MRVGRVPCAAHDARPVPPARLSAHRARPVSLRGVCALLLRCKTELLACSAFALYYVGKATPAAIDVAARVDASRERYVKLIGR